MAKAKLISEAYCIALMTMSCLFCPVQLTEWNKIKQAMIINIQTVQLQYMCI
jgi:hypothetical protein